jgi:hypothetical protein
MVHTSFFTVSSYSSYPEFNEVCEGCDLSLSGECNRDFDEREECYWDYYTTIEAMKEEDEDYKKRQEVRLAKEREKELEKENIQFYTDNPDFLEV